MVRIPFNRPYMTGQELVYIAEAHARGRLAGDGAYTRRCHAWLEAAVPPARALLTHSCTAALEMSALLLDIRPGDEVVMPSYTFVSTANAFVLRGAVPVFVDIRPDTLNIDEARIEEALTPRTRAIVAMHYAGVACAMDPILAIARRHGLAVVEDAAQGILSTYRGRPLGGIGDIGALSFHETKNIICGEGGALLVNGARLLERAEILREKGTDRSRFFRGQVDKYTWQDIGSSYLPGELSAAFLWAQMEEAQAITARRVALWSAYHAAFAELEQQGLLRRPVVPPDCGHNAHMYYLLLPSQAHRSAFIERLAAKDIHCVFHYVPLHDSPFGRKHSRAVGPLDHTRELSERLVRLPLWVGLEEHQDAVVQQIIATVRSLPAAGREIGETSRP